MRHTLIAAALLASLTLLAQAVEAQTGGARGRVVDAEGKGIPEATVVFEHLEGGGRFELRTNDKGEYIQLGLTTGPYQVTVTREGYQGRIVRARIGVGMANDIEKVQLEVAKPAAAEPGSARSEVHERFARGVELTQAGQLDEAALVFEEILELQPGILEVHRNLGYIYAQQEDWAQAETHFLAALELRPGEPDYVAALARIYDESGQEEKARELIDRMAREHPTDGTAQLNYGVSLVREGRNAEAMDAFEAALAADPPEIEAHYYLGTLLVGQGQVPEAIEHLEAYLAADPDNAQNAATARGLLEALKQ